MRLPQNPDANTGLRTGRAIAAALPNVTAAAFGPMMQIVADAGRERKPERSMGSADRLAAPRKIQRTEIAK